ncbi:S8 family serine peptidase [Halobacillus rhizosphaerae]|uniref:S8 family peptidase n=1 Tax=Halobacillus rhizosphaerae TaxID=3064889 RepID=UPI00398ACDC3
MINNELHSKIILNELEEDFTYSWGIEALNIPQVWNKTKGEGVKIATIDTGIDESHPDLKSFKLGINMFTKTKDVSDLYGHGSHVAGLLVGEKTGIAPEAELYVAKVLDDNGNGSMASILDGITFAINFKIDVLCMSLGIRKGLPNILLERIMRAYEKGITIVCATGNSGINEVEYPAHLKEVIGVGGVGEDMRRTNFTNHGEGLDVLAPSTNIISTYKDNNYAIMSGTSMASPFVAGQIALLISYYRKQGIELSPIDIKKFIELSKTDSGMFDLTKIID